MFLDCCDSIASLKQLLWLPWQPSGLESPDLSGFVLAGGWSSDYQVGTVCCSPLVNSERNLRAVMVATDCWSDCWVTMDLDFELQLVHWRIELFDDTVVAGLDFAVLRPYWHRAMVLHQDYRQLPTIYIMSICTHLHVCILLRKIFSIQFITIKLIKQIPCFFHQEIDAAIYANP